MQSGRRNLQNTMGRSFWNLTFFLFIFGSSTSILMNSHELLGALMCTYLRLWALLSIHKYSAMSPIVPMIANECSWPHGTMLMSSHECSYWHGNKLMNTHQCSWALMNNNKHSWAFTDTPDHIWESMSMVPLHHEPSWVLSAPWHHDHQCSCAQMVAFECSWVLMSAHSVITPC